MVRVVLVQPPHRDTFGYSMPPLGLLHVGAAARERGHAVELLDLALWVRRGQLAVDADLMARAADEILARRPDPLGLGAMISSLPAALHLAAEVKRRAPQLPVILGGQGAETIEEALIGRYAAIDAVAVGEADGTLADWLDVLAERPRWVRVPGLVVRSQGFPRRTEPRPLLADLDAAPPPAWDLAEPPAAYAAAAGSHGAMFPIDLGRGCTYACTFCTTPVFWGRRARHLSASRAVDELDRLAALGDVECAYVTHDLFTFDRQRVLDICAEKLARGNTLPWECRTRIDLVDPELLAAMAQAGCRRILYGVESDSADVLQRVNKGGRKVDVRRTLREAADAGLASIVGVMAGVPGETAADLEANLGLMADVAVIDGVSLSLHWMNVTPGNGRQAELAPGALRLAPGLHADLVRGWDLPAGAPPAEQQRLIEHDAEVFAAFRVHGTELLEPADLYLLSRNAHILLEQMPRTAQALALARGGDSPLLDVLLEFLWAMPSVHNRGPWPAPVFEEPFVLRRAMAPRLFAAWARGHERPALAALATYEEALASVDDWSLRRFEVDPLPLVRALDRHVGGPAGTRAWRGPSWNGRRRPVAVLFTRRGDRARAHALSPFLADVADGLDEHVLEQRWPELDVGSLREARALIAELTAGGAAT